jgi:hypothetical protein
MLAVAAVTNGGLKVAAMAAITVLQWRLKGGSNNTAKVVQWRL